MTVLIQNNLCLDGLTSVQLGNKGEQTLSLCSSFKDMFFPLVGDLAESLTAPSDLQEGLLYNPGVLNPFDSSLFLTCSLGADHPIESALQQAINRPIERAYFIEQEDPLVNYTQGDFEKEVFDHENVSAFIFKENSEKEEEKNFDSTRVKQPLKNSRESEEVSLSEGAASLVVSSVPERVFQPSLISSNLNPDQKNPNEVWGGRDEKKKEAALPSRLEASPPLKSQKIGLSLAQSPQTYSGQSRVRAIDSWAFPTYSIEKIANPLSFKTIESGNIGGLEGANRFTEDSQGLQSSPISPLKKDDLKQPASADYPFLSANNLKPDQNDFIHPLSRAGANTVDGFAKGSADHGKTTEPSHSDVFNLPINKGFSKVLPDSSSVEAGGLYDLASASLPSESHSFLPSISGFLAHKTATLNEGVVVPQPVNGPALMETLKQHVSGPHKTGETHLNIQLHPQELGALSIRIHIDDYGQAKVHFIAENQAAHEVLIHYRQNILEIFDQASLSLTAGNLNFSMGQDRQPGGAQDPQKSKVKQSDFSGLSATPSQKAPLTSNGHSLVDIHA